jgi:hypothetical protein
MDDAFIPSHGMVIKWMMQEASLNGHIMAAQPLNAAIFGKLRLDGAS